MGKEALEDIIIKSVEDASGILAKGKKHKAHFLVNEDDAQEYLILLRNYYTMKDRDDVPVMRAFCREVHDYLLSATDANGGKKQIVVQGSSAFRSFQDYEKENKAEINLAGQNSQKDNKLLEQIKNASLGISIGCSGFYAISQHPLALPVGIPAFGVYAVSWCYDHFIRKKQGKKKGELMALNAFLENTDFMLVKDVLDESKDKISAYIDKL